MMLLRPVEKRERTIEFGIVFGGLAVLAVLSARFLPLSALAPACAFKAVTGVPCVTCGSTRSIVFLSHGSVFSAFVMNPLFAVCIAAAVFWFFSSVARLLFNLPGYHLFLTEKERDRLRIAAVLLGLLNWAYLIMAAR